MEFGFHGAFLMGGIMGKIVKSFAELEKACQAKMMKAMSQAESKTYLNANENLSEAYNTPYPSIYKRTYQLQNSVRTTDVQGGGNHLHAEVYLDPMYDYDTGTYTAAKVMAEAEVGGSGILLKSGFWERTKEDAQRNIDESFGKEFGH